MVTEDNWIGIAFDDYGKNIPIDIKMGLIFKPY